MPSTNYQEIWTSVLHLLEESDCFDSQTFKNWILKTALFKIENQSAYISYPSVISKSILSQQKNLFESTLSEVYGEPLSIVLIEQREARRLVPPASAIEMKANSLLDNDFQSEYTFESFVEGSSNAEAYAACINCCHQGKGMFNPLMIYGNPGLGKTHLLHAVGNYLKSEKPEAKVIYMYSGDLVSLLIDAMKTKNVHGNTVENVKQLLLDCDYFLIDDIQNLKIPSSQEVFFTVYNQLINKQAQIILTSDIHPYELSNLESRLVSRFEQGLSINILKPEFATSKAIIKKKLEGREESLAIQEEVIDYLALQFSNDVRSLEGNLNKLIFNSTLSNPAVIDLDFAKKVLITKPVSIRAGDLTMKDIKKAVMKYYGLSYTDLEGKSRQKQIASARHICVYLCRDMLHLNYSFIGRELGNRDHSTISSSYDRACKLIRADEYFKSAVDKIRDSLV